MEQSSLKQTDLYEDVASLYTFVQRVVRVHVPYPGWQDVTQEVMFGLLDGIYEGRYRGDSSLRTYMYPIIKRRIADFFRRKAMAAEKAEEFRKGRLGYSTPNFEYAYAEESDVLLVRGRIEELLEQYATPRQRQAFHLYYYCGGISIVEGAKVMGVSTRMFSTYKHQALRKVLRHYKRMFSDK